MFCVRIIVVLFMYYSFYPLVIGFHCTAMMMTWCAWSRSPKSWACLARSFVGKLSSFRLTSSLSVCFRW